MTYITGGKDLLTFFIFYKIIQTGVLILLIYDSTTFNLFSYENIQSYDKIS